MGTEIGMLGGYGFHGQVTAGDGSDKQRKMGAGYNNLRKKNKKQQCKVGREEEGSSSNLPELAAFFLALRDTPIEEPLLYLFEETIQNGEGGVGQTVAAPMASWGEEAARLARGRVPCGLHQL